jgi:hypothetical protein
MGRKRGRRFRKVKDAQEQLEQIEKAQQAARRGKLRKKIDSVEKSKRRLANSLKKVKTREDAWRECKEAEEGPEQGADAPSGEK